MDVKVRKMNLADVDAVHAIEVASITPPWTKQGFEEALANENACLYVAEVRHALESGETAEVVGYCGIYFAADEGEITNVAVAPAWRKQGIADKILAVVKVNAKMSGYATIFLEVRESNIAAQKLYEKHGFVAAGLRKNFYREPQEHAIVMSCSL